MKRRLSLSLIVLLSGIFLAGCASDPNVEGAKLDLRNEDYDRALKNVNKALDRDPQNAQALKLKGDIYIQKAQATDDLSEHSQFVDQGVAAYKKALKANPEMKSDIMHGMKVAYVNEFRKGSQTFSRAKKEEDDSLYNDAAQYFANAASVQPDSGSAYLNRAFSLLNAGNTDAAITPMEAAIEKGADDASNYRYLARLYQQDERSEDAIALLEEAREKYPEDSDLQSLLLNAYVSSGQTDRAMETYQNAVEREPDNALYRYNYGVLLLKAGQRDRAIEQLQRAVDIDPTNSDAQYNLGASYVQKAVAANDSLRKLNDEFRGNRDQLSQREQKEMRSEMDELANLRESNFSKAIPPLRRAYKLTKAAGEDTQGICQALFQAYVQTGAEEQAQNYSACAGYEDEEQP